MIFKGGCLCKAVAFQITEEPSAFYFCHCEQCRKVTGSAFAANLMAPPESIDWVQGRELLVHYQHPSRNFSKTFCKLCGSGLPHLSKSEKDLVIPAGCLDDIGEISPQANIFTQETQAWYSQGREAPSFPAYPKIAPRK